MAKRVLADMCDDPECMMCQDDDAEAAFWDEFYFSSEQTEERETGRSYTVKLIDEQSGEEKEFEGVRLVGWRDRVKRPN